jgi:hypothetical protein
MAVGRSGLTTPWAPAGARRAGGGAVTTTAPAGSVVVFGPGAFVQALSEAADAGGQSP